MLIKQLMTATIAVINLRKKLLIILFCCDIFKKLYVSTDAVICRHVGMADDADSKSVVGNHVWVQVPLPALN